MHDEVEKLAEIIWNSTSPQDGVPLWKDLLPGDDTLREEFRTYARAAINALRPEVERTITEKEYRDCRDTFMGMADISEPTMGNQLFDILLKRLRIKVSLHEPQSHSEKT